jgi:hypothetical protein
MAPDNATSARQYIGVRSFLLPQCPKPPVGRAALVGDLKPRGLAGNAGSAVPYRAPRTSARHTRDAGGRPRPPDPGLRRVQRHRNDCLLRHMQREGDRAKHRAANKRCPDDSKLFHEISPITLLQINAKDI